MLIALLIAVGIDLVVIVALVVGIVVRKRWVNNQPGEFFGAIRIVSGDVGGLSTKWSRGSGRWVRDVLVWTKGPLLLRNEIFPVDNAGGPIALLSDPPKRIGPEPRSLQFVTGAGVFEIATSRDHVRKAVGPFTLERTS